MSKYHSPSRLGHSRRGFTMLELLTVISIITILSVVTGPAIAGLMGSGTFANSLVQVSGAMEAAQEAAISKNTYTYVGFTAPNAQGQIFMAIFGTQDGSAGGISDVSSANAVIASGVPTSGSGSSSLYMFSRIATLNQVAFLDSIPSSSAILANTGLADPSTAAALPSDVNLTYKTTLYNDGSGAGTITFKRVIQFTPDGEGRVGAYLPSSIQMVLAPTRGTSSNTIAAASSVIQVTGVTGQITTFRP